MVDTAGQCGILQYSKNWDVSSEQSDSEMETTWVEAGRDAIITTTKDDPNEISIHYHHGVPKSAVRLTPYQFKWCGREGTKGFLDGVKVIKKATVAPHILRII
eukprot:891950_1